MLRSALREVAIENWRWNVGNSYPVQVIHHLISAYGSAVNRPDAATGYAS
jgi:hypothetical protein